MGIRHPRFSGFAPDDDPYHYVLPATGGGDPAAQAEGSGRIPAPIFKTLDDGRKVSQWATTEESRVIGFHPAADCKGNFMSYRYQPNNNCYNYACNIATNSFAIPGRGYQERLIPAHRSLTADDVIQGALLDGLIEIGRDPMTLPDAMASLREKKEVGGLLDGHMVALLISKADSDIRWRGDFHFVRCDEPSGQSWSQKDGPDQVTNFDFAGNVIVDPSIANWTVNQGPRHQRHDTPESDLFAQQTSYFFAAWMFVPFLRVEII
jgi:hypothetical protein